MRALATHRRPKALPSKWRERWVVGQVEDTALTGCKLLRSMLSDMGDVVCCLSGLGIATPISVMLPVAHRRRNRPFEEKRVTDWSFEGLLDTPLRLFRSPGPPAPGGAAHGRGSR
eukprot:g32903.t1